MYGAIRLWPDCDQSSFCPIFNAPVFRNRDANQYYTMFYIWMYHGCINLTKRFRQLKFLNVPFSKLLHRNCGQLIGSSFLINKLKFRQNPQKLFILAKTVTFMSYSVFVTRSMMLLLYFKILIISQLLSKLQSHLIGSKVMKTGLCNLQLA